MVGSEGKKSGKRRNGMIIREEKEKKKIFVKREVYRFMINISGYYGVFTQYAFRYSKKIYFKMWVVGHSGIAGNCNTNDL